MAQKRNIIWLAFAALALALALAGALDVVLNLSEGDSPATKIDDARKARNDTKKARIEHGRYLVDSGGCNDCPHQRK